MPDGIPDLGRVGRPQQINIGVSVLLGQRHEGMPDGFVSAADLVEAVVAALTPVIRQQVHDELTAALALSEG